MSEAPADARARTQALDPARSFIVQAPAGSGKTELLIQRYLRLLETVREPEQIVAITFTRKAAAEMRTRIVAALEAADSGEPVEPHRRATRELAGRALAHDRERGWQLLSQTQRLRVDTVDALNAWLAQQLPVLAGGVDAARIVEDPRQLYALAARRTLERFATDDGLGEALRRWLAVVGNALPRLEALMADLLPVRDQWLRLVARNSDEAALRTSLERGLAAHVEHRLLTLERFVGPGGHAELFELLRHVAGAAEPGLVDPRATFDPRETDLDARLATWRSLAAVLLTRDDNWRRRFTKLHGLGPAHAAERDRLVRLIETMQANDDTRRALASIRLVPDPRYGDEQWADLASLRRVLVHLTAELRVLFAEHGAIDFIELALAAQQALGSVDAPSELLLALDQRIEHILVDEFQDTSQSQYRLLELLTAGWTHGDGRSLFLVGDPMQSIYRFRDADMSLFLKVKQRGLGAVRCTHLALETNFRSTPPIVAWVNRVFARAFPDGDSILDGSAAYAACVASRAPAPRQGVALHAIESDDPGAELDAVTELLARELAADADQSIGILVQSRRHLVGLRRRLRERGWAVHAIEIESLAETQIGQDLIGLTRAMLHLGDTIAWLGVLRAPWCGLTWADLERLCALGAHRTIWEALEDDRHLECLGDEGRVRTMRLRNDLRAAFQDRGRHTLSRWIEHCWRLLRGPECLSSPEDLERARAFFEVLDHLGSGGDLDDPAVLDDAFARPRAHGDVPRERGIELMTVHRAKGLEFDTVVLLGLGRNVRGPEPRMLQWTMGERDDVLVAAMASAPDRLNAYLHGIERRRDSAERCRLVYVATTRARDRLHLVSRLDPEQRAAAPRSLLAPVWAELGNELRQACVRVSPSEPAADSAPVLRRIESATFQARGPQFEAGLAAAPEAAQPSQRPAFEWAGYTALHVGTLVHRELQTIADRRIVDRYDPGGERARYERELVLLGVPTDEVADAVARVESAVERVLGDPRGRWILAPHEDARSELELGLRVGHGIEHLRPDRTFVADGTRWIVDFKTSRHEGGRLEDFLASEEQRYRAQLDRYAAALAELDARPVRVGLYFPLLAAFRDWEPAP